MIHYVIIGFLVGRRNYYSNQYWA